MNCQRGCWVAWKSSNTRFNVKYLRHVSYLRSQGVISVSLSYCYLSGTTPGASIISACVKCTWCVPMMLLLSIRYNVCTCRSPIYCSLSCMKKTNCRDWVFTTTVPCHFPTLVQNIPAQSMLFPRVVQELNALLIPGIRDVFSAESRKYFKHTQHTKHVSYGNSFPVRYISSDLLVLLCTSNKTGGGRATGGERRRASDVCTRQIQQQHCLL